MVRLAVWPVLLLLLLPPAGAGPAMAGEARAELSWEGSRLVNATVGFGPNDTLVVAAGANITFDADNSTEEVPTIELQGGLDVRGTAESRVRFSSTPGLWTRLGEPRCIFIHRDEGSAGVLVRNATFTDIVLDISGGAGEFRDCLFDRCVVDLRQAAFVLQNCTFLYSSVTNYIMSYPRGLQRPIFRGCTFEGAGAPSRPPSWVTYDNWSNGRYFDTPAILDWGGSSVEDCTISGYLFGIRSLFACVNASGCNLSNCYYGISLYSDNRNVTAFISRCTVTDCYLWCIAVTGDVHVTDCIVSGSMYGIWLESSGGTDCVIEGNILSNISLTGIVLYREDALLEDNVFGSDSEPFAVMRVVQHAFVSFHAIDPRGAPVSCLLCCTDARGFARSQNASTGIFDLPEYTINATGVRTDYPPYTFEASLDNRTNRTTLSDLRWNVTLVLPLYAELTPLNLSFWPSRPRAGERAAFTVRLENSGYNSTAGGYACFTLDGRPFDIREIPALRNGQRFTVYSRDWVASAGTHTLRAFLDPDGNISEGNRSDNGIAVVFTVGTVEPAPFWARTGLLVPAVLAAAVLSAALLAVRWRRGRPPPAP